MFLYLLATVLLTMEYLGVGQQIAAVAGLLAERGITGSGVNLGPHQFVVRLVLFFSRNNWDMLVLAAETRHVGGA